MSTDPVRLLRGAIALELRPGIAPLRVGLDLATTSDIAALAARDLARFAPCADVHALGLAGVLFDPVEVLRPGWPVHAALGQLLASAPNQAAGRVVAFAGDGLPEALWPDPEHADGPLRLLPWALRGALSTLEPVSAALEASLLDTGMAPADSALALQAAFGVPVEHVRYVTGHDIAALMAMQYEHAGLGAVWPLIEAAVYGDEGEVWLDAPPEPCIRLHDGVARIAVVEGADIHVQRRTRQLRAVLEAHGVAVEEIACRAAEDARSTLA
ncbi:MAG: hypothetical protein ACREO3_03685 [Arenimonas sp.]